MNCQNIRPPTIPNLEGAAVLNVVPMNQEEKDRLAGLLSNYSKLTAQMEILTKQLEEANKNSAQVDLKNRLSVHLENTAQKLNMLLEQKKQIESKAAAQSIETEKLKALQMQARVDRLAAESKLENALKLKEESDQKLKSLQQQQAAANEKKTITNRKVKIDELRRAFKVTEEQVLASLDQAQFDLLKTVQSKRCLAIDEVAMKNVLLPLIYKFNLPGANLAAFKDEISPEAILLFFANVPTTKIRTILIAKPLNTAENAAKAQIEALISQRGGSIKVS